MNDFERSGRALHLAQDSQAPRPPRHHRGAHPDDERLFSPVAVALLRTAAEEVAWLLGRSYSRESALEFVGRHHQLESRQRLALFRAVCSEQDRLQRAQRLVPLSDLAGQPVLIDGLNAVITLEVALSGGVLLRCADDALRDLAGLRGSYHLVDETDGAIRLIAEVLRQAGISSARVLLDAPVSNSGRLRERFELLAPFFGCAVEVELVPNPDHLLSGARYVVSSDSVVIDSARSWVNLPRAIVAQRIHDAKIVDLG